MSEKKGKRNPCYPPRLHIPVFRPPRLPIPSCRPPRLSLSYSPQGKQCVTHLHLDLKEITFMTILA